MNAAALDPVCGSATVLVPPVPAARIRFAPRGA